MKKTQIALAALALVASTAAMADGVKVSGQMDVGVGHTTGVGSYMEQGGWADNSNITFSGSEDLSNGMKAFFTLAAGFTQNGDPGNGGNGKLFSRESLVGLSGDFGTVKLGQQLSPYILSHAITQAGTSGGFWVNRIIMGGGLGAAAVGQGDGAFQKGGFFIANAASYTTPSINGWTATAMTNTANGANDGAMATATSDADKYTSFNIIGAVGGINVTAGYQNRKNTYTSYVIGGSTSFGDLTVAGNYSSHSPDSNSTNAFAGIKTSAYLLSAAYKLQDSLTLVGGYAANDIAVDQSMTNVGLKYDLSKRTFTYVTYVRATGGAQSALSQRGNYSTEGANNATTVVGVAHSF
jgi:predicted porin